MPIISGGGGGPAAGSYLPVANKTGVTVDTTTYSDPIAGGGAKLTTLVFPADAGALAIALAGDTFPRLLLASDGTDGVYLADGAVSPYAAGASLHASPNGDGTYNLALAGASGGFAAGSQANVNRGRTNSSTAGFVIQGAAALFSGAGAPAIGGIVGDLYIRTNGGALTTIYRCTVTGAAGAATWAGIL